MATKNRIELEIRANAAQAKRELGTVDRSLKGLKGALVGLGAYLGFQQILEGAIYFTQMGAAAEASASTIGRVFDDMEGVGARIESLGDRVNLSTQKASEFVSILGNSWLQAGASQEQAFLSQRENLKLLGDISAFFDASMDDVIDAFRSARVGEYDPMEKFVPGLNAGAVSAKALADGLIKTKNEGLSPLTREFVVGELAVEALNKGLGSLMIEAGSTSFELQRLKTAWEEFSAAAGSSPFGRWGSQLGSYFLDGFTRELKGEGVFDFWYHRLGAAFRGEFLKEGGYDSWFEDYALEVEERSERKRKEREAREEEERKKKEKEFIESWKRTRKLLEPLIEEEQKKIRATEAAQRATEEAAKAAAKWAEELARAEENTVQIGERIGEINQRYAERSMDIRTRMARRIAEELEDKESDLNRLKIKRLMTEYGISEELVKEQRAYLNLSDLERALIDGKKQLVNLEKEVIKDLKAQQVELVKILELHLQIAAAKGDSARIGQIGSIVNQQLRGTSNVRVTPTPYVPSGRGSSGVSMFNAGPSPSAAQLQDAGTYPTTSTGGTHLSSQLVAPSLDQVFSGGSSPPASSHMGPSLPGSNLGLW